jgi:hypothetical protein
MAKTTTEVMRAVAQVIDKEINDVRQEERLQAITDVSGVLTWLHTEPPPTIEQLREWTLLEFARASARCDAGSGIRKQIFHYRNLPKPPP